MPRIEWPALVAVCRQLGNDTLPPEKPEDLDAENPEHEQVLRSLHNVLLQVRHNPMQVLSGGDADNVCGTDVGQGRRHDVRQVWPRLQGAERGGKHALARVGGVRRHMDSSRCIRCTYRSRTIAWTCMHS